MKKAKIYLIVTAILLFVLGGVCICNPGAGLLSVAWLIGILTLLSGVFTLLFSLKMQRIMPNAATNTLSGVIQIMLGVMFLAGNFFVAASLPIVFGFWIMLEGFSMVFQSFDFKKQEVAQWWVMLIIGIGIVVLGVVALKNPLTAGKTLSVLVGISAIITAILRCCIAASINKLKKRIEQGKAKLNNFKSKISERIESQLEEE